MKTSEFDFKLPRELVALEPVRDRGSSRLMVLDRGDSGVSHRGFAEFPGFLKAGDMLLLNNTRVLPCRVRGRREDGRELEVLLVRRIEGDRWEVLSPGGYTGAVSIAPGFRAEISRGLEAELFFDGELVDMLMEHGEMPLPPYIKRRARAEDRLWYQTEYAEVDGSIAAPTAGLHFTRGMLAELEARGVLVRYLTLHVGKGTFMPVRTDEVDGHRMENEFFEISEALLEEMSALKGRVVAVGTTVTRAVESAVSGMFERVEGGAPGLLRGTTGIFIRPGHEFRAVGALLTNFHLPRSTPLMLASAFAGRERLLSAYEEAVGKSYRFFSYGDAMLIF